MGSSAATKALRDATARHYFGSDYVPAEEDVINLRSPTTVNNYPPPASLVSKIIAGLLGSAIGGAGIIGGIKLATPSAPPIVPPVIATPVPNLPSVPTPVPVTNGNRYDLDFF